MPTYSYRCTECGTAFDVQQSFTDASLTVCPNCNGVLRKVFSAIGVSFTGSGFYRNDSRAKPTDGKASDPKPSEGKPAGGSASSDKAKPAESKPTSTAKDSAATKTAGKPTTSG